MRIVIVTAIWKRPEVFEMFAKGVFVLKQHSVHEIYVVVAGSEGKASRDRATKHGFIYVETPNEPLAQKHNVACKRAQALNPDYLLFLGSDDVISPELMKVYERYMAQKIDFIGITDWYFYDLRTKKASYWGGYIDKRKGHTVGAGRMISARLMREWKWAPFEIRHSKVLDDSMQNKLKTTKCTVVTFALRDYGVLALDIKSSVNMTPFDLWPNTTYIPAEPIKQKFPFVCAV